MSNRRRIFKIKSQFQDQLMLEIILVTFIFINSLVIVSFVTIETIQDIFQLKFTLAIALAGGELGGLAILYYYTLRQSHRIAGPVYVLENRLREMGQGDLTGRMRLRKGDYFQDTAELFNETVGSLRERVHAVNQMAHTLHEKSRNGEADPALWAELFQHLDKFNVGKHASEAQRTALAKSVSPVTLSQPRV